MKLILDPPAYYEIKTAKAAISARPLVSSRFSSCVGAILSFHEQKQLFAHVGLLCDSNDLADILLSNFNGSKINKATLLNTRTGDRRTNHARQICLDAFKLAGPAVEPVYPGVLGGFFDKIILLPGHSIEFRKDQDCANSQGKPRCGPRVFIP